MADGLLMELEDYNCWTIGEALGHAGPHRVQHLLSRAADRDMIATAYTELRRRNLEQMRLTMRQPG
jgi:hypothetical protein